MPVNNKVSQIFDIYKENGLTDAADANAFAKQMSNPNFRLEVYGTLKKAGVKGIGSGYGEFKEMTGFGAPAKVATQPKQQKPQSSTEAKAYEVGKANWGGITDDEVKAPASIARPTDTYSTPGAIQRVAEQNRKDNYGQKVVDNVVTANRQEEERRNQPVVQTGNEGVDTYLMKTQGQLEDDIEKNLGGYQSKIKEFTDNVLKKKAEEWWNQFETVSGGLGKVGFGIPGMNTAIANKVASNDENFSDAEKSNAIREMAKQWFSDSDTVEQISKEANALGIAPDEYAKMVAGYMESNIDNILHDEQLRRALPKSLGQDLATGFLDSVTGGMMKRAFMSREQRDLYNEAEAMTADGTNPYYNRGTVTDIVRFGEGLLADYAPFSVSGAMGNAAVRTLGAGYNALRSSGLAVKMFGKAAPTVGEIVSSYGGETAGKILSFLGANSSKGQTFFRSVVPRTIQSSLMLGTYENMRYNVDQMPDVIADGMAKGKSFGEIADEVVAGEWESFKGGAKTGAMFGFASSAFNSLGSRIGITGLERTWGARVLHGAEKAAWKLGSFTVEAGIFAGPEMYNKWQEGKDVNVIAEMGKGAGMAIMSKINGFVEGAANRALTPRETAARRTRIQQAHDWLVGHLVAEDNGLNAKGQNIRFTKEEKEQFLRSTTGRNLYEGIKPLLTHEVTDYDTESMRWKTALDDFFEDKTIPWNVRAKVMAGLGDAIPMSRPRMERTEVVKAENGWVLREYGKDNELLLEKTYKSEVDADTEAYSMDARQLSGDARQYYNDSFLLTEREQGDAFAEFVTNEGIQLGVNDATFWSEINDPKSETSKRWREHVKASMRAKAEQSMQFMAEWERDNAKPGTIRELLKKDPEKLSYDEVELLRKLRRDFSNYVYKPGELHIEQAETEGRQDAVDAINKGEVDDAKLAEIQARYNAAVEGFEALAETDKELYDDISGRMTSVDIDNTWEEILSYAESVYQRERLAPVYEYMNAQAKYVSFVTMADGEMELWAHRESMRRSFWGTINGERSMRNMVMITDGEHTYTLVAGKINVGEDGKVLGTEDGTGAMITLDENGDLRPLSASREYTISQGESIAEYRQRILTEKQEEVTAKLGLEEPAAAGTEGAEKTEGTEKPAEEAPAEEAPAEEAPAEEAAAMPQQTEQPAAETPAKEQQVAIPTDENGVKQYHLVDEQTAIDDILNTPQSRFVKGLNDPIAVADRAVSALKSQQKSLGTKDLKKRYEKQDFTAEEIADITNWERDPSYEPKTKMGEYVKAVDDVDKQIQYYEHLKATYTVRKAAELAEAKAASEAEKASAPSQIPQDEQAAFEENRKRYQAGRVEGKRTFIYTADGEKIYGHYVLHDASDVAASHNSENFEQTAGVPKRADGSTMNDNDYKNNKHAQQTAMKMGADYDGRALDELPVVTEDGVVISGNNRAISRQIAARGGTDKKYLADLRERAEEFGFTEEQLASKEHPSVSFEPENKMEYTTENFAKFNKVRSKRKSETEQSVVYSKRLAENRQATVSICKVINRFDTLRDFYGDTDAQLEVIKSLVDNGIWTDAELSLYRDKDGGLTRHGEIEFENLIRGVAFGEESIRMLDDRSMSAVNQTVLRAIPAIVANGGLKEYSLSQNIEAAVKTVYEAIKQGGYKGGSILDYFLQSNTLEKAVNATDENGEPLYSPEDKAIIVVMADVLSRAKAHFNGGSVKYLQEFLDNYNKQASQHVLDNNGGNLFSEEAGFETPSKDSLIKHFIENGREDSILTDELRRAIEVVAPEFFGKAKPTGADVKGTEGDGREVRREEVDREAEALREKYADRSDKDLDDDLEEAKDGVEYNKEEARRQTEEVNRMQGLIGNADENLKKAQEEFDKEADDFVSKVMSGELSKASKKTVRDRLNNLDNVLDEESNARKVQSNLGALKRYLDDLYDEISDIAVSRSLDAEKLSDMKETLDMIDELRYNIDGWIEEIKDASADDKEDTIENCRDELSEFADPDSDSYLGKMIELGERLRSNEDVLDMLKSLDEKQEAREDAEFYTTEDGKRDTQSDIDHLKENIADAEKNADMYQSQYDEITAERERRKNAASKEVKYSVKKSSDELYEAYEREQETVDVQGGLVRDQVSERSLSPHWQGTLHGFARRIGRKIVIVDGQTAERFWGTGEVRGEYVAAKNTLFLNENFIKDKERMLSFLAGHETTHILKEENPELWESFVSLVKEDLGEDYDAELELRRDSYNAAIDKMNATLPEGEKTPYLTDDDVVEELCADWAGVKVLTDESAIRRIIERADAQGINTTTFAQKVLNWIHEALARVKEAIGLGENVSNEEKVLKAAQETWQKMYDNAVANQNKRREAAAESLREEGAEVDVERGDVGKFSVADILKGKKKDKAIKELMEVTGRSEKTVRKWLQAEQSLAKVILDNDNVKFLDMQVDESVPSIWNNSDYPQGTVEFSNICRKRLPFTMIYQRLQEEFPNTVFNASTLETIRGIMKDNGVDVACGLCFVEDRRQLLGEIGQGYIDMLKGAATDLNENQQKALQKLRESGDEYVPNLYELLTLDGMKKLRKEHPAVAQAFVEYNNARGMQAGRLFQAYSAYHRDILDYTPSKVKRINDNGGLRIFSFSDFEAHHLIDLVQVLTDCAAKGIKVQGYTKVPEFAKAVKDTGMKVNRSLIAKDAGYVDADYEAKDGEAVSPNVVNGKRLLLDTVEGIDVTNPDFFDSSDNKNVGNILVGINDEHIRIAMEDPFVDYIIPFHSGLSESIRKQKGIGDWVNYKLMQLEKQYNENGKLVNANKHGVNIYTNVLPRGEELIGHEIRNARDFQEAFFKACEEKGWIPRFEKFINKGKDGKYKYTPGYEKLLIDFKLFDKNGKIIPQEVVKPLFDNEYNKQILDDYVKGEKEKVPYDDLYDKVKDGLGLGKRKFSIAPKDADGVHYNTARDIRSREEFARRQFERAKMRAKEWSDKLKIGDTIDVYESIDDVPGADKFLPRKRAERGWFDQETGRITVVIGNHRNPNEVVGTILHEAVGRYGLRKLFGENFDNFLDNVYKSSEAQIRTAIDELLPKYNGDKRRASEEYLATLAENTDFERAGTTSAVAHWFNNVKQQFLSMLAKIGLRDYRGTEFSDNELRYVLWRSYKNMEEPGRYRNRFNIPEVTSMEEKLGVGNGARIVRMGFIEDEIPAGVLTRNDEIKIRERVSKLSFREAVDAYNRVNAQMLDEDGLNIDQHSEKVRQDWIAKNGTEGLGKAMADDLEALDNKYGWGKILLRWELIDRINELGKDDVREENPIPAEGEIDGNAINYTDLPDGIAGGRKFSIAPKDVADRLDKEPKIKVYRAMQLQDGKLYPPMAAKVNGKWQDPLPLGVWSQADEHPELVDKNGKFTLDKGNGKKVAGVVYAPYMHGSTTMLNDQFKEAQDRPELVVVEAEMPESELTSGYQADKSPRKTGALDWKAGTIQGQLTGTRQVILSRWVKPTRIVPPSEVAENIKQMIDGQVDVMPTNVVTPEVREELEKLGVQFVKTNNKEVILEGEHKGMQYSSVYGGKTKNAKKFSISSTPFYSNAERAVENIKQEKATPEQWLKMVEKSGGLKAAEDKWLGLSDWLKGQDKKSLTKQEVIDYIRENQVQVEEVSYQEGGNVDSVRQKYPNWDEAFVIDEDFFGEADIYIKDFEKAVDIFNKATGSSVKLDHGEITPGESEEILKFAEDEMRKGGSNPINPTRLTFTTRGLENKKEIALTVPTIESWGHNDNVHFGDAGDGRAVAWVRFGDAKIPRKDPAAQKAHDDAKKEYDDYSNKMYDKYGAAYTLHLNEAEQKESRRLLDKWLNAKDALKKADAPLRVLVIDEIQSKRHQEGREKGYRADIQKYIDEKEKLESLPNMSTEQYKRYKELAKIIRESDVRWARQEYDEFSDRMKKEYGQGIMGNYENWPEVPESVREEIRQAKAKLKAAEDNASRIPAAPFEKNWHELAMKRMLRYAAENGYDKVAWTKGGQQAERYSLGKVIDEIGCSRKWEDGTTRYDLYPKSNGDSVSLFVKDGKVTQSSDRNLEGKDISEVVGKDLAEKMQNMQQDETISIKDQLVGGEGMKGFYDQMLPRFMDKYGKKWGVKTGEVELPSVEKAARKMWAVDVTPEMKESVMQGQPMYRMDRNSQRNSESGGDTIERIHRHAEKVAKGLGVENDVKIHDDVSGIANPRVRADIEAGKPVMGWFDEADGSVHLYTPNISNKYDAEATIRHEHIGHKGMRGLMGEQGFRDYMHSLWYGEDAALHDYVSQHLAENKFDLYDTIEEFLSEAAEKKILPLDVWFKVRNAMTNVMEKAGFSYEPSIADVKYMVWLSKNRIKGGDPLSEARRNAMRWRLAQERSSMFTNDDGTSYLTTGKSGKQQGGDGVHYATGSAPSTPRGMRAKVQYHMELDKTSYVWTEAFVDYAVGLKKAMEAMAGTDVNKIKDFENAYLAENQMSSVVQQREFQFNRDRWEPLNKTVNELLPDFSDDPKEALSELEKYMRMKHGLERNREFFVRDWLKDRRQEERKALDLGKTLNGPSASDIETQWNDLKDDARRRLHAGAINYKDYITELTDFIKNSIDDSFDPNKQDRGGLVQYMPSGSKEIDDANFVDEVLSIDKKLGRKGDEFWSQVKSVTDYGLDSDYQSGVISKSSREHVGRMFEWYVPLRGFSEDVAHDVYDYIGLPVKNPVSTASIVKADKRSSESDSPLAVMAHMSVSAISRGVRNEAKQRLLRFVRNHTNPQDKNNLISETSVWLEKVTVNGTETWVERYPTIRDNATPDEVAQAVEDFNTDMKSKEATGDAMKFKNDLNIPYKALSWREKAQHFIEVNVNGEKHLLVVNGNPRAAQAMNGLMNPVSGNQVVDSVNRFMSSAFTTWNPSFVASNTIRDAIMSRNVLATKENGKYVAQYVKNWHRYMWGKGFTTGTLWRKYHNGTLDVSKEDERYFKEFMENGGETGFVAEKNVDKWKKEIMESAEHSMSMLGRVSDKVGSAVREGSEKVIGTKAAEALAKYVMKNPFKFVEDFNERAENMARFATYMTSRQMGRGIVRSIQDAKDVSVNFNRKGAGAKAVGNAEQWSKNWWIGKSAQWGRGAYIFFNAGCQSLALLGRNIKNHPIKTATFQLGQFFLLGLAQNSINQMLQALYGDDDTAENAYANLPEWTRRNNICIFAGHNNFVKIPLPIELRAFYGLGDVAAGYLDDERLKSTNGLYIDMMSQVSQLFPVDYMGEGGSPGVAFMPDLIKPLWHVHENRDWTGKPIQREETQWNKYDPGYTKAFRGENQFAVNISKKVNELTGGDDVSQGWLERAPKPISTIALPITNPAYGMELIEGYAGGMGKTFIEAGGIVGNIMKADWNDFNTRNVPIAKALFQQADERTAFYRTRARYFKYGEEFEQLDHDLKGYKKGMEDPLHASKLLQLGQSRKARQMAVYNDFEKKLKALRKVRNKTTIPEQVKLLDLQENQLMEQAVKVVEQIQ